MSYVNLVIGLFFLGAVGGGIYEFHQRDLRIDKQGYERRDKEAKAEKAILLADSAKKTLTLSTQLIGVTNDLTKQIELRKVDSAHTGVVIAGLRSSTNTLRLFSRPDSSFACSGTAVTGLT